MTAPQQFLIYQSEDGSIIEPFVASVGFIANEEGRDSKLRNLGIEPYRAENGRVAALDKGGA
ncbi:MAG: hypothetical protein Q7T46_05635 [Polaromonas sp.]|nr:hypothetical protein [Polaromonas sp.]